jgi:hypothetical protein
MNQAKKVQLNIYIPEQCRDRLRIMAAEQIIRNPGKQMTGAGLAAEIVCAYLNKLEETEKEDQIYE